jgi:hypothetical protein
VSSETICTTILPYIWLSLSTIHLTDFNHLQSSLIAGIYFSCQQAHTVLPSSLFGPLLFLLSVSIVCSKMVFICCPLNSHWADFHQALMCEHNVGCCECKPAKSHLAALCCLCNILIHLSSNRQMFNLHSLFIEFIVLFLSQTSLWWQQINSAKCGI